MKMTVVQTLNLFLKVKKIILSMPQLNEACAERAAKEIVNWIALCKQDED